MNMFEKQNIPEAQKNSSKSDIRKTLENIAKEKREEVYKRAQRLTQELVQKVSRNTHIELSPIAQANLELKLLRHFQKNDMIDENVLYDAIIETPKFLNESRGSIQRLLEIHQIKTIEKIAEMRKKRAEDTGEEGLNPYEALFPTDSGDYYMARLQNMPHLREESGYMKHCVGTSSSYINKIKRGEIEILSFRKTPQINKETQKLEGDTPLITVEYDVKRNNILQMKKKNDKYISYNDPYFSDFVEALQKLQDTEKDNGEKRKIDRIDVCELSGIPVETDYVATGRGHIPIADFDYENDFILKRGEITDETPDDKITEIIYKQTGKEYTREQIAITKEEITKDTRYFVGDLKPEDYDILNNRINPIHVEGNINFTGCTSLTTLPEGLSFGGTHAFFDGCTSLEVISKGISFPQMTIFKGCTSLKTISEGVSFGMHTDFKDCTSLKTLPKGISFEWANFDGCSSLEIISEGVSFGDNAFFADCTSLKTISEGVSFSGEWIRFYKCISLETLSKGISFGGDVDFTGCTLLTSLPEDISFGGDANFTGCTSLTEKDIAMLKDMKSKGKIPGELVI